MCFLKRDWSLYDYWASIKPLSFPLIGSSIKTNQNFARIDNVGECTHTHTLIYIIDMINNANWGFREAEKSWADLLASAFTPVWRRGDKRKSTKTIMNWQRGLPWRQKGASHRLNPSNPSSFTPLSGPQQNMTSHSSFPWSNIPEKAIQRGVVANFASNFHSGTFLVCEWEFGFLAKIEKAIYKLDSWDSYNRWEMIGGWKIFGYARSHGDSTRAEFGSLSQWDNNEKIYLRRKGMWI